MRASRSLPILALALVAMKAEAGVIRGHWAPPSKPPTTVGRTTVASGEANQGVVWVDSLPPELSQRYAKPQRARVVQAKETFVPRVTAVAVGSPVRFMNRDDVYHQVFSVSPAKRFDLGRIAPHADAVVTFDQPGIVDLYDELHPEMAAYVVVLPHRLYTRLSRSGDFILPDLPPGTYALHLWHPAYGEMRRTIEVPRYGVVTVALSQ
jgi:plastocyanin